MFVLCGNLALGTRIPNIAIFDRQAPRMEVASRKHLEGHRHHEAGVIDEFSADPGIDELAIKDLSGSV